MAQIITCDGHNGEHPADWLLTRLVDGEVQAYCDSAFLEFVTMAATAAASNEADGADQEAIDRLEAIGQADDGDGAELTDQEVQDRLEGQVDQAPDTAPARTVRKGQSAKARAHQARQAADDPAPDATVATAQGPDDDEDEDEDGGSPTTGAPS